MKDISKFSKRHPISWAGFLALFACLAFGAPPKLKAVFQNDFLIGAAINARLIDGKDPEAEKLLKTQFNAISPENILKWGNVHPQPDKYNFALPDKYVRLGEQQHFFILGHNLVWHQQTPRWVFEDNDGRQISPSKLEQRLSEHIMTVVGRYKGRINGWDVVNEALEDDGTLRDSNWRKILGDGYIAKAFLLAHQADPQAELYYNDYSLWKPAKRDGVVRLVKSLQEKGIRIDGVGMQGHWGIKAPSVDQIEKSIAAFSDLGVKVMITELDIDLLPSQGVAGGADIDRNAKPSAYTNPYTGGLPDSVQSQLAKRYADLFSLFHKHRQQISRVTFWGVNDAHSWLNNWPAAGEQTILCFLIATTNPSLPFGLW